jgi:hypothetical protein
MRRPTLVSGAVEGITMISAHLVEMIEIHANRLTVDVVDDLMNNERTRGFRTARRGDIERRIFEIFHNLGNWVGNPTADRVRSEFVDWGRQRFGQGIPLSEIVYAIMLVKQHLRRYIRDNSLVEAAYPRVEQEYILPMYLHDLQELNARVGEFFDEALYDLACGYEAAARQASSRA